MSSVSDDIFGDDFLNHDTDHTSPAHTPVFKSKPAIRPKPAKLSPTDTTPNLSPEISLDAHPIVDALPVDIPGGSRCVIAVDFGTTFTGVAMAITDSKVARTEEIELMQDYGEKMSNNLKVPSVISYSLSPHGQKQWGMDIADDSVTMVNTKMQLDIQDTRLDELETTLQILQGTGFLDFNHVKNIGTISGYTWKSPVDVATDYLKRVRERICLALSHVISRVEVDVIITVPVDWSDRATELTYKAFDKAGFNKTTFPKLKDMILVTEPEAASYYTALENREAGNNILKKDEIFILCDAGGGTVDVIAFMVKSLEPHLELVRVSEPSKNKCGGSFVDANFKGWLRQVAIGKENFAKLDKENALRPISTHTSESGPMRELMKRFDAKKKTFSHATTGLIKIDLPPPLDRLNVDGRVRDGELTIHPQEMGNIFKYCVNKVVELIDGLAERVTMDNHRRIKNCFLVGGFGESPYLQELLKDALDLRSIELRAPKSRKSWTAAAMGAVVYGIEKGRMTKVKCMHGVSSNYGIVVKTPAKAHISNKTSVLDPITNESIMSTFAWMIRRGDLIMSDATKRTDKWFRHVFKSRDDRELKLQVYEYSDPDDKVPLDFLISQREVETLGFVDCDLSRFALSDFGTGFNETTRAEYYTADLRCKMSVSLDVLEVEVLFRKIQIGYTKISLGGSRSTWTMPDNSLGTRVSRSSSSAFDHNYMTGDDTPPGSPPGRWT